MICAAISPPSSDRNGAATSACNNTAACHHRSTMTSLKIQKTGSFSYRLFTTACSSCIIPPPSEKIPFRGRQNQQTSQKRNKHSYGCKISKTSEESHRQENPCREESRAQEGRKEEVIRFAPQVVSPGSFRPERRRSSSSKGEVSFHRQQRSKSVCRRLVSMGHRHCRYGAWLSSATAISNEPGRSI